MQSNSEFFSLSKELVPGGVHSPVRSFKGLDIPPIFVQKAQGAFIYDMTGNDYIDFCMSFGPLILGHRNNLVEHDLVASLERGWSFGACEPYSLELANYIIQKIPHIEQIRFMNSGTEAVMTAIRLARGVTKKNKIVKFNGCYHGHTDSMLIKAGSGLAGTVEASSAGVTPNTAQDTVIFELGDSKAVEKYFHNHAKEIAAVIIEPLPANCGLLIQNIEFLKFLRNITTQYKSLLIFDEVISGFRCGFGGMSERTNISPDLVTYGKIIGGGLPVGAVAGSKEIMENLAPIGDVYQAGTLSANPLAMVAGLATLKRLTSETYQIITQYADNIVSTFDRWLKEFNNGEFSHFRVICQDSLFWFAPKKEIKCAKDISLDLIDKFPSLFNTLIKRGIYISPHAYEIGFVSLSHDHKVLSTLEHRLWK